MAGLLTQAEADALIEMLKRTLKEQIELPSQKGEISFNVVGDSRENEFVINIDRKGKKAEKCTYQGRVWQSNQVLMRLDINPTGRHTNPGGEVICGNHLHIYNEEYGMNYAIPFDIESRDFYQLCFTFFEKFHIIEPPEVYYQDSL